MRAIMVAVDYTDLLAVTLAYNRHHFEEVNIITSPADVEKIRPVAWSCRAGVYATDLFYADGAVFNKWRALEWGLDQMGRHGWLCLMDSDVLWPKDVVVQEVEGVGNLFIKTPAGPGRPVLKGQLCAPLRRMAPWPLPTVDLTTQVDRATSPVRSLVPLVPEERTWKTYPVHRNVQEWAGYSQIFHADDPVLGPPPWHDVRWVHCGGADSFFQMKWPRERKVRPPFECLHLGEAGANWMGRATPYADGTEPPEAGERRRLENGIWAGRRANRVRHGPNSDVYRDEKLP